jgi:hypothetical protein
VKTRTAFAAFAFILISAVPGGALYAHHSQAGFETPDKAKPLKGTVVEYRWRNPHVLIFWDVKEADGKNTRWVGELGSVTSVLAGGTMNKNSLKPGDEIQVLAIPSRAGTPEAIIRQLKRADGTILSGEGANTRE